MPTDNLDFWDDVERRAWRLAKALEHVAAAGRSDRSEVLQKALALAKEAEARLNWSIGKACDIEALVRVFDRTPLAIVPGKAYYITVPAQARDASIVVEINKEEYKLPMDQAVIIQAAADLLKSLPRTSNIERALKYLEAAQRETTERVAVELRPAVAEETARTRLKWGKDRTPDEDPAHFAARAYAAEIGSGTFDKSLIRRNDRTLYQRLFRDKAWGELAAIGKTEVPTKPQRNTERLREVLARGEPLSRSKDMSLYDAGRYRLAHAKP